MLRSRASGRSPLQVRQKLLNTRKRMEDVLAGVPPNEEEEWYDSAEALAQPLLICYWSLWECGESACRYEAGPNVFCIAACTCGPAAARLRLDALGVR